MSAIAEFTIESLQFLDPNAEVVNELPNFAKQSDELIKMYRLMVLVRTFDTKAVALQRTGKMGTYAGITGQEAISVALGAAMQKDDVLAPSYRDYGAMLQRGVKMSDIFAYWGGDERGSRFNNPHDLPIAVPIASQCLHAAGVAVAFKYRKQPQVAFTICGDGGTSKGDFYEAINLAGDWQLPMVFVINNNQWAISVPRNAQTNAKTLAQKAIAAGIKGIQVDGNDIIAVRHAITDAAAKARDGGGPTVIEALTYRLCDHTTADDAKRYCPADELTKAWQIEPVARLRTYLTAIGAWSDEQEQQLLAECSEQVEQAVQEYMNLAPQKPESMFDSLYAELPSALEEQRQDLLENCSS